MAEITLEGMDELIQLVESLGPKAGQAENEALKAGGKVLKEGIKEEIRQRGLVDSGLLLESINVSRVKEDEGGGKFVDVGPSKKRYPTSPGRRKKNTAMVARFLEFGTSKRPATPFVDNTKEAKAVEVIKAMEAVVWRWLGL